MPSEVRTMQEGSLWWVQASGSGLTWATASAPASGLVGFVQSFSHTNPTDFVYIRDRGRLSHQKFSQEGDKSVSIELLWTGNHAIPTATASGASVPMFHFEHRASAVENPGTGVYWQYCGCTFKTNDFTENAEGNTIKLELQPLAILGPTASGYIR